MFFTRSESSGIALVLCEVDGTARTLTVRGLEHAHCSPGRGLHCLPSDPQCAWTAALSYHLPQESAVGEMARAAM